MSDTKSLTVRQAALKLGNTQKFVRDLLYEGKLPGAYKAERAWRIPPAAIEQRLKEREARNG